jgi:hypothetical protein
MKMKKVLLIAAVAVVSFASCKKDRTCTCTTTTTTTTAGGGSTTSNTTTDTNIITATKARKGDVKKMCIDSKTTQTDVIGSYTYTQDKVSTCSIK